MNRNGSVLMISLWVLAILVVFAVGLGNRASINLRLSRYQRDSLKSYYLAKAGLNQAITVLDEDLKANAADHLKESWATGKDNTGKFILKDIALMEGSKDTFTVGYVDKESNYHCISDEESKIDINNIEFGLKHFEKLLLARDFAQAEAGNLVKIFKDWITSNTEGAAAVGDPVLKKGPLKVREEIIPVLQYYFKQKESTNPEKEAQDLYAKIKDSVTVYTDGKININTASEGVLRAILMACLTPGEGGPDETHVNSLMANIMNYRNSIGAFQPTDNLKAKLNKDNDQHLNTLIDYFLPHLQMTSGAFEITSAGNVNNVLKKLTVIYKRGEKDKREILSWQEN